MGKKIEQVCQTCKDKNVRLHLLGLSRDMWKRACERAEAARGTARAANQALIRERNTWARQMADVQGQRDDAIEEAAKATAARYEVESERDDLSLRLEDIEKDGIELARYRELLAQNPPVVWGPPGERGAEKQRR